MTEENDMEASCEEAPEDDIFITVTKKKRKRRFADTVAPPTATKNRFLPLVTAEPAVERSSRPHRTSRLSQSRSTT
jgi:hypothetical protein